MTVLTCPKCQGRLDSILYQGIEVDRCCQCAGIWFDDTEVEALKGLKGSETIDLGDSTTPSHDDTQNEAILCPRCQMPMNRLLDMDKYPIWYEQCPQCYGIWLDAGEFNQFKQNFSPQGWLSRLKKRLT
jgi:Zn-finger nucleic acid-binding protein